MAGKKKKEEEKEELIPTKRGIFQTLYDIDVEPYVDLKGGKNGPKLKYLKWAVAFRILIQKYPESTWRVLSQEEIAHAIPAGMRGFMVGTEITIKNGEETLTVQETLPVTNYKNDAIVEPTSMDINTSIKRCYVKTMAHMGLGMRIFENVEYPEDHADPEVPKAKAKGSYESPSVASVAIPAANDGIADSKNGTAREVKAAFVQHCKQEGLDETDAVNVLKEMGYETYGEIPVGRVPYLKGKITEVANAVGSVQKDLADLGRSGVTQ